MTEKTLKKARGLNSIADPSSFRGSKGRSKSPRPEVVPLPVDRTTPEQKEDTQIEETKEVREKPLSSVRPAPKKQRKPSLSKRIRRELSVPLPIAEALEETGINPADIVMSSYRKHSDAIYAGEKARRVYRGRRRLRLSVSEKEFDQLTRLGESRGWNRSETVSVLLAAELMDHSE